MPNAQKLERLNEILRPYGLSVDVLLADDYDEESVGVRVPIEAAGLGAGLGTWVRVPWRYPEGFPVDEFLFLADTRFEPYADGGVLPGV